MKPEREAREHILAKATEDEGFRACVVADAKGSVEEELGIRLHGGRLEAREESAATAHTIPPPPSEFGRAELQAAAGGHDPIPWDEWRRVRRRRGRDRHGRARGASTPSGPCPSGRARASVTRRARSASTAASAGSGAVMMSANRMPPTRPAWCGG